MIENATQLRIDNFVVGPFEYSFYYSFYFWFGFFVYTSYACIIHVSVNVY